ncbi:SDR family NAD(P)-dependent oxidoreductase [Devosia sp. 1635]|uniref:SDR family NAD(P)-dependent oxidoreductase n=2 Tax=unclassified Devosia TaxID=196773 RepID=UPI0032C0B985
MLSKRTPVPMFLKTRKGITMAEKVWFLTGGSRGFGRIWTEAALKRGDKVAVAARDPASLVELTERFGDQVLPLTLDVTDSDAAIKAVHMAHDHFGRLDIVVCNAGFGMVGAVEEVSIEQARLVMDTDFFGMLAVVKAALPIMRAQGSGHILTVASTAGIMATPCGGLYNAAKFAVVGLGEALAGEVARLGINVTIIEPGPHATDFTSASSMVVAQPIDAYGPLRDELAAAYPAGGANDPRTTAAAILAVVDAPHPPLHLLLGSGRAQIDQVYAGRTADWDAWSDGPH